MTLLNMISDKQKTLKPPADLKFHKDEQGNIFAVQLEVDAWDELLSQLPNPEEFDEKVFQPPESSAMYLSALKIGRAYLLRIFPIRLLR